MIIQYKREINRASMAQYVANCMSMGSSFEPYKPMEHDESFWTVDAGNDWKLKFNDEGTEMEIRHRYNSNEHVIALTTWIAYRTGGEIIQ